LAEKKKKIKRQRFSSGTCSATPPEHVQKNRQKSIVGNTLKFSKNVRQLGFFEK